jgi:P4 family phage/plasmid primase-like protien
MPNNTALQTFRRLFFYQDAHHAEQWRRKNGETGYSPACLNRFSEECKAQEYHCETCSHREPTPLTDERLVSHLKGKITLGAYQVRPDGTAGWLCMDVDADSEEPWARENAKALTRLILAKAESMGIPTTCEDTGNKGYHVWAFVPTGAPAQLLQAIGVYLVASVMDEHGEFAGTHVEVFPKQDSIQNGKFGNLVKVPLGIHKKTGRRCVLVDASLAPIGSLKEQVVLLDSVELLTAQDLADIANDWGISLAPPAEKHPAEPIGDVIPHGKQHDTLVSLAGTMRRRGMGIEEIDAALQIINKNRCEKPGPPENIRKIAESVCGYTPEDDVTAPAEDYHMTDLGNARRFVAMHQDRARFDCSSGMWLIWNGQRWKEDPDGETMRMAKETVRAMFTELATIEDKEDRKRFFRFVMASEGLSRLTAQLKLAETEPEIAITRDKLDADPWLFNVLNGTLNLRTGELLPHNKEHLIARLAPVEYDPEAALPMWDDFLMDSTGNDEDMVRFLARTVGYSLTGDCREEKLFFVHGPTNSGKSTFLEAIKSVMGDYATTADFETFLARSFVGGPRPDIARLAGSRFVASIEVDEGKSLAEGLVKQITGGDTVTARFLYKSEFEFLPQFKLWLAANHAPEIKHDDAAMWRRILKLPFEISVPEDRRDPAIKETLKDTAKAGAAILAWAVRGCLDWQKQGLAVPEKVTVATDQYRRDQDPLREFILSSCVLSENVKAPASSLRSEYESWCREAGEKPIYGAAWGEALRSRGCTQDRQRLNGVLMRVWQGIGLIVGGDDDDEPLPF